MFAFGDKELPGVSKIVEESGELNQVIGRLMQTHGGSTHWASEDLRKDFIDESADLQAAINFFNMKNLTAEELQHFNSRVSNKLLKFLTWHRENAIVQ